LCLKRSWSDFDPQAYYPYDEDQNHETSFKGKALQAVVDSWCKIQVLIQHKLPFLKPFFLFQPGKELYSVSAILLDISGN
jgi:hypothetical protein